MPIESIEIKSKNQSLGSFDYEHPSTLEEGLDMDGEDKVFKLYAAQRKIRWVDGKRRELTGGGLPKAVTDALKSADPDVLKKIAAELGIELG